MYWKSRSWILIGVLLAAFTAAHAQIVTTQVADIVSHADGTPATGTALVSWPAFTTANGDAIPAGSTSAVIAAGGALSVQLIPNAGATPIGSYYTVVYHLDDGSVSRQYWVVPASSAPVKVGAIESTVLPASVAMQTVSKSYVDTVIAAAVTGHPLDSTPLVLKAGDTMTGPLVLPGDPVSPNQAADKNYVDESVAAMTGVTAQTVSLAGDLSGTASAPMVTGIRGNPVAATAPAPGQTLTWNGSAYAPATPAASGVLSGQAVNHLPVATGAAASTQSSSFTDNGAVAGTTEPFSAPQVTAGVSISKLPRVDVTAFGADPTCATDATAAVQSAYTYADSLVASGVVPVVYFPHGCYSIGSELHWSADIGIAGDGRGATTIKLTNNTANGFLIDGTASTYLPVGLWTVKGFMRDLSIVAANNHFYSATQLELYNAVGYVLDNVEVDNGGGRGIVTSGYTERVSAHDIYINSVRMPLVSLGNEVKWDKLQINSPGQAGDYYTWDANAVNGIDPMQGWTTAQTLTSAVGAGSTGTFVVTGNTTGGAWNYGSNPAGGNGISPLLVGHNFAIAGAAGTTCVNGIWTVATVANNTPSAGEYTLTATAGINPTTGAAATFSCIGTGTGGTFQPAALPTHTPAIYLGGVMLKIAGGSIKTIAHSAAIESNTSGGLVDSVYIENFSTNSGSPSQYPENNPVIDTPGLPATTMLTAALPANTSATVGTVASTLWLEPYANDLSIAETIGSNSGYFRILPCDYIPGSTVQSTCAPTGVLKGMFENVQLVATTGNQVAINARNLTNDGIASTAPAGTPWPSGSYLSQDVTNSNFAPIDFSNMTYIYGGGGGSNWDSVCIDGTIYACGAIMVGSEVNNLTSLTIAQNLAAGYAGSGVGNVALDGGTAFVNHNENSPNGVKFNSVGGSVSVHGMQTQGNVSGQDAAPMLTGSLDASTQTVPEMYNAPNQDGSYPSVEWKNYDDKTSIDFNGYQTYLGTTQNNTFSKSVDNLTDPLLGANPNITQTYGAMFGNSYCNYDVGTTLGAHSVYRFCWNGSLNSSPGFEWDKWSGTAWVKLFNVDGAGNLTLAGNLPPLVLTGLTGNIGTTGNGTFGNATVGLLLTAYNITVTNLLNVPVGIGVQLGDPGNVIKRNGSNGNTEISGAVDIQLDEPVVMAATAPTGSCSANGVWVFSQDMKATVCSSGTWQGYVSTATASGQTIALAAASLPYSEITMYGDSLTLGNQDGSAITMCTVLATLSGLTCNNEGIAGDTSSAIAARMGAVPVYGTVTGNSIPASGAVAITFSPTAYAPITSSTTGSVPGTLCGIAGNVTYSGSAYSFTRTASGSVTACAAGTQFIPTTTGLLTGLVVIEAGTNNYTAPATVLSDVKAMAATVTAAGGKYVVLNPLVSDLPGNWGNPFTLNHVDAQAVGDAEAATYPNNFINWREMLMSQYNSSSTPDVDGWVRDITPISQRASEYAGTLSATITASTCSFTTSFNGPIVASATAEIGTEQILIEAASGGTASSCIRGYNGTTAASHTSGAAVTVIDGIHLGGATGYTYTANLIYDWMQANPTINNNAATLNTVSYVAEQNRAFLGSTLEQTVPQRGTAFGSFPTQTQVVAQAAPLLAQAANLAETTIFTTTYTGWYTVCAEIDQTQVATTSGTLPNVIVYWTRGTDGTATDAAATYSNTVNAIWNNAAACIPVYALAGSNIAYQTTGYASSGTTPLQYALSAYVKVY